MKKALYVKIEDFILSSISGGTLADNAGLPSERSIAKLFNASHIPVRKAIQNLVDRDILYRINGKGTFVKPHSAEEGRKTGRVGILHSRDEMGFIYSPFYSAIMHGIETELYMHDMVPMMTVLFREGMPSSRAFDMAGDVDGFIFIDAKPVLEERLVELAGMLGKPAVMVNYHRPLQGLESVVMDDHGNMKRMAAFLAGQGHRRIACIHSEFANVLHPNMEQRLSGYRDGVAAAGLPADETLIIKFEDLSDEALNVRNQDTMLGALMAHPEPPTAIMCCYDELADRVITQLRAAGYRVPEDVSVTGHDDTVTASSKGITTVHTPLAAMGKMAVRKLRERIDPADGVLPVSGITILPGKVVARQSHSEKLMM